jgi:hypothetical protein
MKTEHWALLMSLLALVASIGIPVWQSRAAGTQARAARRSLLLQTILTTKTTTYVALHQLNYLLQRHGSKMEEEQRAALAAMLPRMRAHYTELEQLHDAWANFEDGASLTNIQAALTNVDITASEATETALVIESGRKSYEDT